MRILDLFAATLGLIILSPVALLLAVLVKLTSPGPVFYRAARIGRDGRRFYLYKFRSMQADADKIGPGITAAKDPRITPVGRFLRRTKLDELPQLLNVLNGDISLVGPRPEDPRYVARYTPEQRRVLSVRPGITSAASLVYRHEEQMLVGADWETRYITEIMPAKLAIDLDYLSRRSLWVDLNLILRTAITMFEAVPLKMKLFGHKIGRSPYRISSQQFFPLILGDGVGVLIAFLIALLFRFDGSMPAESWRYFCRIIPLIILLYGGVNVAFGLYAHIWRYADAREINGIFGATTVSTLLLLSVILVPAASSRPMPLSAIILGGLLSAAIFAALRYRHRLLTGLMGRLQKMVGSPNRRRVLIVGAGESGQALAHQLRNGIHSEHYELVGFVDDDSGKLGLRVHGLPILGNRHAIPGLTTEWRVSLIVIAIHNLSGPTLREILSLCMQTNAQIKMLPDFLGAVDDFKGPLMRDIAPADLLGRQPCRIDKTACRELVAGKVVLVTGAAGSIGSELCRQLFDFQPQQLLLLDNNETGLHDLTIFFKCGAVARSNCEAVLKPIIADVSQPAKMEQLFKEYRPQIVFHTAAYKHVPLMEQQPDEAVRINVLGTNIVSRLAANYGAERFVLISSDKAVNPSSVMGATKRLGEMMIMNRGAGQAGRVKDNGHKRRSENTLFTAVRFGNVLGSRGSVVTTFTRQIEMGGPVTITHPDMVRYFISIPEAVSLVIQAAALTQGGDIFMLDMGQQIRIADLAHKMIRLRGLRPGQDIPIEYTGIRPGEKLQEELITSDEERRATSHPQIFCINRPGQQRNNRELTGQIARLIKLAHSQQRDDLVAQLWRAIQSPRPVPQTGNGHIRPAPNQRPLPQLVLHPAPPALQPISRSALFVDN